MVCLTLCYFRDVPGVEVLMEQHQTRKVEIDAREDSFQNVVKMGKDLIARNHYATPEVKNNDYFSAFTPMFKARDKTRIKTEYCEKSRIVTNRGE